MITLNNYTQYADRDKKVVLFKAENVCFSIGKINAISGPSGSGKSTFFNSILENNTSYEGQILWDGEDIKEARPTYSLVTADLCIIPELTILEFLHIVTEDDQKIQMMLSTLQLEDIKKQRLSKCWFWWWR